MRRAIDNIALVAIVLAVATVAFFAIRWTALTWLQPPRIAV